MYKRYTKIGYPLQWRCKCGNELPDDRNFCVQCDRERPGYLR